MLITKWLYSVHFNFRVIFKSFIGAWQSMGELIMYYMR